MTEILCIQCSVSGKTYVLSIASGRSGQITVWITVLEHAKPELPRLICACSSDLSPVCSAGAGTMPITGLEPVRAVTLITSFVKRHPLVSVIAKDCIAFYFLHRPMAFPGCFFCISAKTMPSTVWPVHLCTTKQIKLCVHARSWKGYFAQVQRQKAEHLLESNRKERREVKTKFLQQNKDEKEKTKLSSQNRNDKKKRTQRKILTQIQGERNRIFRHANYVGRRK